MGDLWVEAEEPPNGAGRGSKAGNRSQGGALGSEKEAGEGAAARGESGGGVVG